jgi:GntR family transcriptional regulator/MocR family aminotransferase
LNKARFANIEWPGLRPHLELEIGSGPEPTYHRVASAIVDAIRSGRLRPGQSIPGTRRLSEMLEVHRNTVKAAYTELLAQGWIATRPSSGTFVSRELPDTLARAFAHRDGAAARAVGFPVPASDLPVADEWGPLADVELAFTGMDPRLMPRAALSRAYRRALASRQENLLGYRLGRGHPRLISALRAMLADTRGVPSDRALLVTRGSQMALYLAIRDLLRPGDSVAVENPGYAFSWPAFRAAGVHLLPIPVDRHGMRIDKLAEIASRRPIRAVVVTPHMHYPTGVSLAAARRIELLDLARARRFAVFEDDWVHEVRYEGRPILPLASADPAGNVLYFGSISKIFAPAVRIGYVAGPEAIIERLARMRTLIDVCGDSVLEHAIAELLEDGEIQRHVRRVARVYRRRRDLLMEELTKRMGSVLRLQPPSGGTSVWVEVDPSIDADAWARAGLEEGVGFLTGRSFFLDRRARPFLWLGFAGLAEHDLVRGVARMEKALARARRPSPRRGAR